MAKNDEVKTDLPVKVDAITSAKVEKIIKDRALLAAGMGIVPVPVLNLASVTVVQISMVQSISKLYDIEAKKSWIKNIISAVLGGITTTGGSGFLAAHIIGAPLVGASLAVLTAPALNGLITYALGYMFARYFESNEGFFKTNVKALRDWFAEGFKQGREKLGSSIAGKAEPVAEAV
jgi:uncharacterized protein (DUF697 family)